MNITSITNSVSYVFNAVKSGVQWLGHYVKLISTSIFGGASGVLEKGAAAVKAIWSALQPLTAKFVSFASSSMGVISLSSLAAVASVKKSQESDGIARVAFGALGLGCAVAVGMVAANAGFSPAFLVR